MLSSLDQPIKHHSDRTQDDNGRDHHTQLEHLRPIYNEIPKPPSCSQKLSDDDAHKRKPDIDLHIAEDQGDRAWQDHFGEGISAAAAQSVNQFAHLGIYLTKSRVEADDGAKERHGDSCHDDGVGAGPQPHDE